MSPSVYCCGSRPASDVPAKSATGSIPGSDERRIASSGFETEALGIGSPPSRALGIGALGIGASGIGADGIGADGIGALGIGADGIGAAPTAALGIGALGIGAAFVAPASSWKSSGGNASREKELAPAVVVDWSTVKTTLETAGTRHGENSDVSNVSYEVAVAVR